jgi:hypothetical protein
MDQIPSWEVNIRSGTTTKLHTFMETGMKFEFYKVRKIPGIAEEILLSQEALCSV